MRGFKDLKGSCPICDGARKDCRQSNTTGLVFCRDTDANPLDYIFLGEDSWGFGMWADCQEAEEASKEQQQEWRQREIDKQRLEAKKKQRSQCLQEAIAEQHLTDWLEHLESLGFLGEQTQLFFLNLGQYLQRGCGV